MSQKLFPEYLGVSSQGAAVVDLQMFLLGMLVVTHNKLAKELKPDGDYGDVTRRAVWWLQGRLNRMRKQHSDTSWPVLEEDGKAFDEGLWKSVAVLRGHAGQVPGQQHAPGLAGTKRRRARDTARRGGGDARAGGDGAGRLNAPTMRKRGLKLASRS